MILTDEEREALFNDSDLECYSSDDIEAACKFAAAVEREVLRKLREREPSGYLIDWPDEPDLGDYFSTEPSGCGRSRPLHIIPEVNE